VAHPVVRRYAEYDAVAAPEVVVEFGESGSGCQLSALELKSGYLLRLIVSFHGDVVGVGIGGSEEALSNVGGSEISGCSFGSECLGGTRVAVYEGCARTGVIACREGLLTLGAYSGAWGSVG
jgi:hypothetical protein